MPANHLHTYTVEGRGYFPFDMLRYDSSWPARQEDVVEMLNNQVLGNGGVREVRLSHRGEAIWTPTVARWESFGWHVLDHKKVRIPG